VKRIFLNIFSFIENLKKQSSKVIEGVYEDSNCWDRDGSFRICRDFKKAWF